MNTNVNAGKRVAIATDGFAGTAGFTEADGKASLSFPSTSRALRVGMLIDADERRWIVEKVGASRFLRGFKVLDLRLAEGF